ncbi:outer envelope protein [Ideonella dechloratans]|uniref:outer envelope protein n=1 Tax=Ideonella dechloratans TaxID=36863 RepID=UPI0035B3FDBD
MQSLSRIALAASLAVVSMASQAADWSDTSIGYRYGSKFAEPFGSTEIHKNIFNLTHVSGYSYGTNFFNVDLLMSDKSDPSGVTVSDVNGERVATPSHTGAQEAYVVYRHTLDLAKVTGKDLSFSVVKNIGLTAGFDWNAKNDVGYNSRKRMLVAGPTFMFDVPGFLNVSLLQLWESNAPSGYSSFSNDSFAKPRYSYDAHPMLTAAWSIPVPVGLPISFEGFANFIVAKGKNEFGNQTAPETNIDMQLMYDVGTLWNTPKKFKVGFEYQYWKNKFGNSYKGGNDGAFAKTPMIRAEYHF